MSDLTPKQAKLIKGIASGKTQQQAAVDAGYGTSPTSASSISTETLKIPKVQEAMVLALKKQGIDIDTIVAPVAKALKATVFVRIEGETIDTGVDDLDMQLRGHDRAVKLIGLKNDDGTGGVTNNFLVLVDGKMGEYGFND